MSPTSKEELRKFEQRMHDKGSDGFADGPRPWEHWDESGNQANSRVWEGSARRVYGSRSAHGLGHRLLSFLAFLALATLLVGIGGVYYTHMQTQQVAQQGVQPLPITPPSHSVRTAPEPLSREKSAMAVAELNVLTAPAAGSVSDSTTPLVADDKMADADSSDVATAPPAAETPVPAMAAAETATEGPEAVTAGQPVPPTADSNIDSVAIETVVTENSVTTTVYTRHPQQEEPEVIAAIETTPPPFVHEVTPAAETAAADTDSATTDAATMASDETSGETPAEDTTVIDVDSEAVQEIVETQDMLTLTSPGTETPAEETATIASMTTTEDIEITVPAEIGADAGEATMDLPTAAPPDTAALASTETETGADKSLAAAIAVTGQDKAATMVSTDKEADAAETAAPSEPAAEETTAEAPAAEETTQIALADPASTVEDTTPAETAQASTAVNQPIMPVAKQGGWVINLASYTWKSTANKKLALFKNKGVDAEVFEVMIKDKPMYRIRVTGFESSRAAKAGVASIEQTLELEGAWVSRR